MKKLLLLLTLSSLIGCAAQRPHDIPAEPVTAQEKCDAMRVMHEKQKQAHDSVAQITDPESRQKLTPLLDKLDGVVLGEEQRLAQEGLICH